MFLYGLIGYPLSHSFSKEFFRNKFEKEGLTEYAYQLFPIETIEAITSILALPNIKGLNVTIPYKQDVLKYLYDSSLLPAGLNACNCIKIIEGKTYGYNTDVPGFEQTIIPYLQSYHNKALILGNGGATEAVKYVFAKKNIAYKVVSRKLHNGSDLTYDDLDEAVLSEHLIIVNTTPLGMYPNVDSCPAIPYGFIGQNHFLFDLTYNPEKTLFLRKGEERGATIKNGAGMLMIQAEESWKIWTTQ